METKCTYVALQVRDIERSISFYLEYCGMHILQEHADDFRVVWMGWDEQPPRFAIVLLDTPYDFAHHPPHQHIGMVVSTHEEVDAIYARATANGISKVWPPTEGGPIVERFCGIADPDGNMVAFSYGPRLG